MNPNTLLYPEGDHERRRHAHTACVVTQRKSGNPDQKLSGNGLQAAAKICRAIVVAQTVRTREGGLEQG